MDYSSPGRLPAFPWAPLDMRVAGADSWVRFVDPATPDAALLPGPVLPRAAGSPAVSAQWREWQEAVLTGQAPAARPRMLVAEGAPAAARPDFGALAPWPDLRRYCEEGWSGFHRWFRAFGLACARTFGRVPSEPSAAAVLAMAPGQAARIEVVGLSDPAVLREEPGHAVLTLGFVASERYLPWLRSFTAAAPLREEPPDWFAAPEPPRPGSRRASDIGGHRVFPGAGSAAQWLAFADPHLPTRDLMGAPAERAEAGPDARRQWTRWWTGAPLGSDTEADRALTDFITAAPDFPSLAEFPALQEHCRSAWRGFREWLPRARGEAEGAARGASRRIAELHALHPRWRKASTLQHTIEVAAADSSRILLETPGFAVVTAGFVGAAEFTDWALEFTADPE